MQGVIQKGSKYSDPDFQPKTSSIYDDYDKEVAYAEREAYAGVVWKRASEIYSDC